MAAKSLSATMTRVVNSQISQAFICASNTTTMQKAGIHRLPKRPNTANPKGWSATTSKYRYKVPSSGIKNEVIKQLSTLNNISKHSLGNKSSEAVSFASGYHRPERCLSLDRKNHESQSRHYALNTISGREDDFGDDNDRVLAKIDAKTVSKVPLADQSVVDAVYENIKEVTKDRDKLTENKINVKDDIKSFEALFSKNVQSNDCAISKTLSSALNGNDPANKPGVNDDTCGANVQRSFDINLNDDDLSKPDPKKNLSLDINVLVNVNSLDNIMKNEIGFQDIPRQNGVVSEEGEQSQQSSHISNLLTENTDVMSREDLTQEIGEVYDFLKNNGKIQITNSKQTGFDTHQNYNKIKNLYLNALGCVKAFKELRMGSADCRLAKKSNSPVDNSDLKTSKPCKGWGHDKRRLLGTGVPIRMMNVRTYASDSGTAKSDCDKAKRLPCLQSSELSGSAPKVATKSVCEKLCMPCCKPARDPPTCFYPYHKPPCKKEKPPRPAYSECKQLFEMKPMVPCECIRPRATSCKPSADSETCTKK